MTFAALSLALLAASPAAPAKAAPAAKAAPKADPTGNAMKEALKDTSAATADGGMPAHDGPDVSKMSFSPDNIRKVIAFAQPKVQTCYEETLAGKDKEVEGVLMTRFHITPEGYVKGAEIAKKGTTLKESKLHDCVLTVLSTLVFPVPDDKKDHPIEFPFKLKAVR